MLDLKADDDGPNPQWIEFFVVFFGSEWGNPLNLAEKIPS